MKTFVARKRELERLERAWASDQFEFVTVYGRIRVGKTFMLEHFLEGKPGIWYQAKRSGGNLTLLSEVTGKFTYGISGIRYDSYSTLFDVIAKAAEKERIYFLIDEISFLQGEEEGLLSLFQYYVDRVFSKTRLMLIFCGSSRSFLEKEVLADPSPLYGRSTLIIHLKPFQIDESSLMFPESWPLQEVAAAHVICSGIAWYESFLSKHDNLEEALRQEFFSPGALIYEPLMYLMSEFRAVRSCHQVLESLASGITEVSRISDRTGLTPSNISKLLSTFEYQGLVERKTKVMGKGTARGWELTDGFFAFYYKFVFKHQEDIELGDGQEAAEEALSGLEAFAGRFIEKSFHSYVRRIAPERVKEMGRVNLPDPETHRNEELDLLAFTEHYVLIGECKWRKAKTGVPVLRTLESRGKLASPDARKLYYLLSLSGFTEDLLEEAASRDDLILLTASDLLGRDT